MKRKELIEKLQALGNDDTEVVDECGGDRAIIQDVTIAKRTELDPEEDCYVETDEDIIVLHVEVE